MKAIWQYLAVAGGGALGTMLRLLVGRGCASLFQTNFPVGTLVINLSGSLFLGWFATIIRGRISVSDTTYLAIAVGFVGAYTTFSTFMFESMALMTKGGEELKGIANLVCSLLLGLVAVWTGMLLGSR